MKLLPPAITARLAALPENGLGYQNVRFLLDDGLEKVLIVLNTELVDFEQPERIMDVVRVENFPVKTFD